jgi:UDP-4-amino-4-deoxy-L-arabinose-oxoglutarate aminotransferase
MIEIPHSKPLITKGDKAAIEAVLESDMIAEGARVRQFEEAVSNYLGLLGGFAVASGTNALFLSLRGLGVGIGDEVILPTYVCRSVWDAVVWTGATPVLCDIREDWCIDVTKVKPLVTRSTRAVIVVHTFGIAAEIHPLCDLDIPIIEDCCQALGAKRGNRMVGTFGELCVLSFHATKLLTTGEGGMVLTGRGRLLEKLSGFKQGSPDRCEVRYRAPLTDFQAALGLSQLRQYDSFVQRRQSIADYYFTRLADIPVELPILVRDRSIFFRFPLRIRRDFEEVRLAFHEDGIHVRRGVDTLLHRLFGMDPEAFPEAERCFAETLSIPLYPALTDKACERIVRVCHRILG